MTRTTDTLIDLRQRAPMCRNECDLFVSIHVNSMPRRRGYEQINGVETYFLGDALTEEARRVAEMENEALRYETGDAAEADADLAFIFKDLHTNEFLRESALLADLVQSSAARVHPGEDRGVSQNRFVVLATATRPAILLETGFATNRRDGAYLASTDGQWEMAKAAADGIVEYLKQYENKVLVGNGQ
jgi:N-acetylmuramoyl-L-alanine amidase